MNNDPIRVNDLYNVLLELEDADSEYFAHDPNISMKDMESAAGHLVRELEYGRKSNHELRKQCREANIPVSAPILYTPAKGPQLDTDELLKGASEHLQSLARIYNAFESVQGFGAFADYQSFMGIESAIENPIGSRIETPIDFVDFLIICARYLAYESDRIDQENKNLAKLVKR